MIVFRKKQFNEITHLIVHGGETIEKKLDKPKPNLKQVPPPPTNNNKTQAQQQQG